MKTYVVTFTLTTLVMAESEEEAIDKANQLLEGEEPTVQVDEVEK